MQRGDKKNWIIGALLIAVVAMSVGYAALGQTLTISGTADISDARFDVAITNIVEGTMTDATTNGTLNHTRSTADFVVDLAKPGAQASYIITVTNAGNIDAELTNVTDLATINAANPTDIEFTVTGATAGDKLAAGSTATVTVTARWKSTATEISETQSKTATIILEYTQD